MIAELAIVIPTLNERDNIDPLVERLDAALDSVIWEAIFVDDASTDGTHERLHELARSDERIRYIRRLGRQGLSSACLEGMAASSAPYLAIMDADLQHDETLLTKMHQLLAQDDADIVVGSRYMDGGGVGDWPEDRQRLSRMATRLGNAMLRVKLTDPLSGFFMLKRDVFERAAPRTSGQGFKILLDLITSTDGSIRIKELPFVFRQRHAGQSKLDTLIALEYLLLLLDKTIGRYIPVRFVMFVGVGSFGALLHVGVLGVLVRIIGTTFVVGQTTATVLAMILNFVLNNVLTHRDRRLQGLAFARGLTLFMVISAVGAIANVRIAVLLFDNSIVWWLAGLLGAVVGAVWNYAVSAVFVWSRARG